MTADKYSVPKWVYHGASYEQMRLKWYCSCGIYHSPAVTMCYICWSPRPKHDNIEQILLDTEPTDKPTPTKSHAGWESTSVLSCSCGRTNTNCNERCQNCGLAWPPFRFGALSPVETGHILPEQIADRIESIVKEMTAGKCLCGFTEYCERCGPTGMFSQLRDKLDELCDELRGIERKPPDYGATFTIPLKEITE
jgi:hypothetical protein